MALRKTTAEFIADAIAKHAKRYNYSRVVYVNNRTPVEICDTVCGTWFWQTPQNHLTGLGCPHCARYERKTTAAFITEAIAVHSVEPGRYVYSRVVYKRAKIPVEIFDTVCGNWFWQTPQNHLSGHGCPHCSRSVSMAAKIWLTSMGLPDDTRHREVTVAGRYKVDGYDPEHKIVYEFLGALWHGHPSVPHRHPNKRTHAENWSATEQRLLAIRDALPDWEIRYVWGFGAVRKGAVSPIHVFDGKLKA